MTVASPRPRHGSGRRAALAAGKPELVSSNHRDRTVWASGREREIYWGELQRRFARPLEGYVRRLACTAEDRNDILGDVWAEAVEWEAELVVSDDPWSLLRQCLKVPCAAGQL